MPLSIAVLLAAVLALASHVVAHLGVVGVYGANGHVGYGYGINIYGKFPRRPGQPGDAGGDISVFEKEGLYPQPPCGASGELGEIDTVAWLSQAEGFGVPSAHPNGSIVFEVFQVNRDGGGPMFCAYSHDASLSDESWVNMTMTLNMFGKDGFVPKNRDNQTIVATFPKNAVCSGGIGGNTCVVRCRAGVNSVTRVPYRFGGCFAVRLNATEGSAVASSKKSTTRSSKKSNTSRSVIPHLSGSSSTGGSNKSERVTLSSKQMSKIVNAVVKKMKRAGLVYKP